MSNTTMTNHDLAKRRSLLQDLKTHLAEQEQQFAVQRARLQVFVDRYTSALAPLYMELDALESQLHSATTLLAQALQRNGVQARLPKAPQPTALPQLPQLPAGAPFPVEPEGGWIELGPPPLKTLYRRAAKRFHPDLASSDAQRRQREEQMMLVNQSYDRGDRKTLERLLLAAGEDSVKVTGGNADAIRHWLTSSEVAVQGRLRVVQAHRAVLDNHAVAKLSEAILKSEELGLDPLGVMASRLRAQIAERRQEIYIGQRLDADSELAESFLRRCMDRGAGLSAH
ncbi:MAG: J domain-containing protein [Paucibacter sp.]|nr:J domain-containing protein [Roseateles sp.]